MTPVRYIVQEVHNFGGFFGGDTITLTVTQPYRYTEQTITIDQQVLLNVRDRHSIRAGMLFALTCMGNRVDQAELLGAASYADLRNALGPASLTAPIRNAQILSYYCESCQLWVAGAPNANCCRLCNAILDQNLQTETGQ